MGLSAQDRVVFTRLDDGTTIMRAKTRSIVDLKGLLKRGKGAAKVKIEDMNIGRDDAGVDTATCWCVGRG